MERKGFRLEGVRQEKAGRVLLDGVDLELPGGVVTALMGPSGAGKTSLLRLLNRLDDPRSGAILYDGRPLAGYPVRVLRRRVGFVFQTPVMLGTTVRSDLELAAEVTPLGPAPECRPVEDALALAEVDPGLLDRPVDELSGGQKQRVNIARALVTRPDALLLDEPTSALDPATADRLTETLARLADAAGLTVVFATHRFEEARRTSQRAVVLVDGRIVEQGETGRIFDQPADPRTRAFLRTGRTP